MTLIPCPSCKGGRLRPESLAVKIEGLSIHELTRLSVTQAISFLKSLDLIGQKALIAEKIVMRDLGNTILVVEHDPETIMAADYVIDMGPGAGIKGGQVIFEGLPESLLHSHCSLTGRCLSGIEQIPIPTSRRTGNGSFLTVNGSLPEQFKRYQCPLSFRMPDLCYRRVGISDIST